MNQLLYDRIHGHPDYSTCKNSNLTNLIAGDPVSPIVPKMWGTLKIQFDWIKKLFKNDNKKTRISRNNF